MRIFHVELWSHKFSGSLEGVRYLAGKSFNVKFHT